MNASTTLQEHEGAAALVPNEVRNSVQKLLASPMFAKAPRMCHLLSFLVEKKLSGRERELSEYAIGLEVFRRDARLYDTTLDPVVRVQMGRLRERLATYYASLDAALDLEITIPPGNYVPVVRHGPPLPAAAAPQVARQICLTPLRDLAGARDSGAFASGVDEELMSRLFATLGLTVQLGAPSCGAPGCPAAQRLEGSIRVEQQHVRASMRLIDPVAGQIKWLSQFNCSGPLGMPLQEELASAIVAGLQRHLAVSQGGMLPS